MNNEKRHILLSGGGTLGPVTPLIAIADAWRDVDPDVRISWIGTPRGPERELVEQAGMEFYPLFVPKLDRHRKWTWPFIPFLLIFSTIRAYMLLKTLRPEIVFTAGGYVSVPVVWSAFMLRIPSWVHQLDVVPVIANKLMAPFAKRISVTFAASMKSFSSAKVRLVGLLVRNSIVHGDPDEVYKLFPFDPSKPLLFVFGGGTGAQQINDAMDVIAEDVLQFTNVLHITGRGKMKKSLQSKGPGYAAVEFMGEDIAHAYAAADLVVARSGIGTLLELAATGRPAILVPLPDAYQEKNALALEEKGAARVIVKMNPQILKQEIRHVMADIEERRSLSEHIGRLFEGNGAAEIVRESHQLLEEQRETK